MIPNTNPDTGIPYGVISGNSLNADLCNELHIKALNVAEEAHWNERREHWTVHANSKHDPDREIAQDVSEWVEYQVEAELRYWSPEEPCATIEHEGITLVYSFLGGAALITSCNGPTGFYTKHCSPCVPNAVDLDSGFGEIEAHGVPLDWYAKKPARYVVVEEAGDWCVVDALKANHVTDYLPEYNEEEECAQGRAEMFAALLNGEYVKKADVLATLGHRMKVEGVYSLVTTADFATLDRLLEN